jgi:hypothetical protein
VALRSTNWHFVSSASSRARRASVLSPGGESDRGSLEAGGQCERAVGAPRSTCPMRAALAADGARTRRSGRRDRATTTTRAPDATSERARRGSRAVTRLRHPSERFRKSTAGASLELKLEARGQTATRARASSTGDPDRQVTHESGPGYGLQVLPPSEPNQPTRLPATSS